MKKILISIAALTIGSLMISSGFAKAGPAYGGVKWQTYETDMLDKADKNNTPVLLYITAGWCQFCKEMEEKTFRDPAVAKYIANNFTSFTATPDDIELIKRYNITALPATLVLDGKGEVIDQISGYRDKKETIKVLMHAYRQYQVS